MLSKIKKLPKKNLRNITNAGKSFTVYLVQDFNLKMLNQMVELGQDIFGETGTDEWALVPQIRHGNVFVLLDDADKKFIGMAILMRDWEDIHKAYLYEYSVSDKYQGQGLGYEFLKIICEDLIDQDFEKLSLTVDADNEAAVKLYRDKIGFENILFVKNEYGKGEDRQVMELDLKDFSEQTSIE